MFKNFISALFKKNTDHKNGAGFIQHHFSGKKFNRAKTIKSGAGFTLTELMVVTTIMMIMTAVVLINYRPGSQQLALDRSAHKLAQDIRRAQEMAMSSKMEGVCGPGFEGGYGIRLHRTTAPLSYILFADCNNDQDFSPGDDEIIEQVDFEPGVEIMSLTSNHLRIIFYPPDPITIFIPSGFDNVWVNLGISSHSKIIRVNNAGLIYVE